jgi:hypothetical protein
MRESCDFNQLLMFDQCKMGKKRNLTAPSLIDDLAKTAKLPTIVIPALDNNTQGQATAGIQ